MFHPVLIYSAVLLGVVAVILVLAHALGPWKRTAVKDMPYESGMDPVGDARQPFDVKFYLVAILFMVFDVELLLLYPWAVSAYDRAGAVVSAAAASPRPAGAERGPAGEATPGVASAAASHSVPRPLRDVVFGVMLVFLTTLAVAYVYAWKQGVFRWR